MPILTLLPISSSLWKPSIRSSKDFLPVNSTDWIFKTHNLSFLYLSSGATNDGFSGGKNCGYSSYTGPIILLHIQVKGLSGILHRRTPLSTITHARTHTNNLFWINVIDSSGSSSRVRGAEKHEIYSAAFGGHLFYDLFSPCGGYSPLAPPPDPLLIGEALSTDGEHRNDC